VKKQVLILLAVLLTGCAAKWQAAKFLRCGIDSVEEVGELPREVDPNQADPTAAGGMIGRFYMPDLGSPKVVRAGAKVFRGCGRSVTCDENGACKDAPETRLADMKSAMAAMREASRVEVAVHGKCALEDLTVTVVDATRWDIAGCAARFSCQAITLKRHECQENKEKTPSP
jgi:hypothetical protein